MKLFVWRCDIKLNLGNNSLIIRRKEIYILWDMILNQINKRGNDSKQTWIIRVYKNLWAIKLLKEN